MGSKKYPSILPAPTAPDHSSSSQGSPVSRRDLGPKRLPIAIACNSCRRSDGCTYTGNRAYGDIQRQEILHLLRSLPEGSASDLLATIRDNRNDATVLSNFKATSHGTPYSAASEWESALPQPTLSPDGTLETELMAQYPCAYPALAPILASDLARSDLLGPISGFTQQGGNGGIDSSSDTPEAGSETPGSLSAPKPSPESDYYDERLRHLKTRFWTDVDIADNLAARIISLYLTSEHPLLGFFDPRLFLDDLLGSRERFCSRLLFHSLMQ
ncbi:putative Zn(2)-C6 fungal-type domain-containing protein [Seiridium cardinale]|uniref:Zn(2)-C6 fungal-type domain-containing protein n=1 Tax=Seiridium cardinale TaxID=138064 RepID=A0ABR2X6D5_9PEZI